MSIIISRSSELTKQSFCPREWHTKHCKLWRNDSVSQASSPTTFYTTSVSQDEINHSNEMFTVWQESKSSR